MSSRTPVILTLLFVLLSGWVGPAFAGETSPPRTLIEKLKAFVEAAKNRILAGEDSNDRIEDVIPDRALQALMLYSALSFANRRARVVAPEPPRLNLAERHQALIAEAKKLYPDLNVPLGRVYDSNDAGDRSQAAQLGKQLLSEIYPSNLRTVVESTLHSTNPIRNRFLLGFEGLSAYPGYPADKLALTEHFGFYLTQLRDIDATEFVSLLLMIGYYGEPYAPAVQILSDLAKNRPDILQKFDPIYQKWRADILPLMKERASSCNFDLL